MTAMKLEEMRALAPEERAAKLKEWTQALFNLRIQKATGQLENPMRIREVRKDIARLKTVVTAEEKAERAKREAEGGTGR